MTETVARRKRRFSLAPIYVGLMLAISQVVVLHLVPFIVQTKGLQAVPRDLRQLHDLARAAERRGASPAVLGGAVAVLGLLSVALVPVSRYLWWLIAAAACCGFCFFIFALVQVMYLTAR